MAKLIGQETFGTIDESTQVYKITHDGAGNSLPYMDRSFISFTFGGKAIEDFGLIVTIADRLEKPSYAPFTDLTSTYDTLDGQLYWGSKMEPNQIDLTLSTDGMTDVQLDQFREWFAPGKSRELILSEHPNRAIIARIATPPILSLLPFEKQTILKIGSHSLETSTTIYKGDISISFIMDESFWYLKNNYMPNYINKVTLEPLTINDTNENKVISLRDKDMIKIMLEDGIPYQGSLTEDFLLGVNRTIIEEARVNHAQVDINRLGTIIGVTTGLDIAPNNPKYLFYSGTAPSYPIVKFSLQIAFNADYISLPANKIQNSNLTDNAYSYIAIGDNKMYFTTPGILTAYNKAIQIFKNKTNATTSVDLLNAVKLQVNDFYARAWAIKCINKSITQTDLLNNMKKFFKSTPIATFTIDSKTGEAIGTFDINTSDTVDGTTYITVEENVGDMIHSKYLVIEGRNYLNSNGEVEKEKCHKITSNLSLINVLILFQNMYL